LNSSEKFDSPYYPRRARWYGRIFSFGGAIRHGLALDRIYLPSEMAVGELIGSFLIPGLAFYLRGPRLYGKITMTACALLFLCFIIWLGYSLGNCAFGLMLSIHASGFVYYCGPYLLGRPFSHRIIFTLLVLTGIGLGFYLPIQHVIQNHWLMPLRNGNQVIVVSVQGEPASLKHGDWAAFATDGGILFGPIVGLGGEQVDSLKVPDNHWLIRAQFTRRYYHEGLFPFVSVNSDIVEKLTIVSREEFAGKPFKRWFWRKQILP
jgi:hypothetical protein